MLIELLKSIFDNNEFSESIVKYKEYSCYLYAKDDEDNFFIVLDKKEITEDELNILISNGFSELYELLIKLDIANKAFEKNTTLILCLDLDSKQINKIEEDTYLFKKNVIVYSEEMRIALKELLKNDYSLKNMNSLLNNNNLFEDSKKYTNNGYTLLSRLFIKLPFLCYERGVRKLENLSSIIESEAEQEGFKPLYEKLIEVDINNMTDYAKLIEHGIIEGENE